jgi:hypothetical protein
MTDFQAARARTIVTAGKSSYHDAFILPRDMLMTRIAGDAGSENGQRRKRSQCLLEFTRFAM